MTGERPPATIRPSFHDTLERRPVHFRPLEEGRAGLYTCGPTVYNHAHIGNLRTFLFEDLLRRALRHLGYRVTQVMNLTDVDDKIIAGAVAAGVGLEEFTAPYVESFFRDLDTLHVERAEHYPRATEHVPEMIALVERLVERGHAYVTDDGSVFYDISSFPDYGKLSRIPLDEVRTGERVADDNYEKGDARDFALWKATKPVDAEVGAVWEGPVIDGKARPGRPGWHLECSAMSMSRLGETFDLHAGGEDLVFPHHEDEIAQSEGATGKPFVRCWLHARHLMMDTEKMSKSLGNVVGLKDVLERGYTPAVVRYLLISAHYRKELTFSWDALDDARAALRRLADFQDRLLETPAGDADAGLREIADRGLAAFEAA
ncbi:MAG TPA: cysteine--tRNA ligase, partial [Thermoanaerobaculia bacterium]|nr:cysteine--tRNA ligase [Thermoanaerobaculia bacterium]